MQRVEAPSAVQTPTRIEASPNLPTTTRSLAEKVRGGLKRALNGRSGRVLMAAALSFAVITGVTPGRALANGDGNHHDSGSHDSGSHNSGGSNNDSGGHVDSQVDNHVSNSVDNHVEHSVSSEVQHKEDGNHPHKHEVEHSVVTPPVHPGGDHKSSEPALVTSGASSDSSGGDVPRNDCPDNVNGPVASSTVSKDHLDCKKQTPEVRSTVETIVDYSKMSQILKKDQSAYRRFTIVLPQAA